MGYVLAYFILKSMTFIGLVVGVWHLLRALHAWDDKTITKKED